MRPGPICAWRSSLARHGFSGFSRVRTMTGEFFVLIRRVATLERLMQPRPLHADGKVAPVIPRHRAGCASFRTRRGDICSPPGQRFPSGAQIGEPLRRARLDEHEHLFARIPKFPGHMQPHGSFQLAEHIALAHQPGARKRLLRRQIARGPLRLYASGFAHQLLADGAHRGLAFQTRRPFQPQQRVRRKRHRARTRAAVQQGFGASPVAASASVSAAFAASTVAGMRESA